MDTKQEAVRSLREIISYHLAMLVRYGNCFSLAMFSAEPAGHNGQPANVSFGNNGLLRQFALLVAETVREIDFIASDQNNNLVVVMPQTDLAGACAAAERVKLEAQKRMGLRVRAGVAMALDGETNTSLVERAGAALRQAIASGGQCVWYHNGISPEPAAECVEV